MNIVEYVDYNLWANSLLASALREMSEEQLNKEIVSSFPSVQKTIHHIYGAEKAWMLRLQGESLTALPEIQGDLIDEWIGNSKQFLDFVKSKPESYFAENCTYKNIKGDQFTNNISDMIHHCMNHSTFHRGQLVTMMRQCGVTKLPQTDFIAYKRR